MATKLGDLTIGVNADVGRLPGDLKGATDKLGRFSRDATAAMKLPADLGGLKQLERGLDRVHARMGSLRRESGGFAADLAKTAGGFAAGTGLVDLLRIPPDIAQESVRLAAGWERAETQLSVLLGTAEEAKDTLGDLKRFGTESGLGLDSALKESLKLLAAGVSREQLVPTLGVLSDLAMGDREKFGRSVLAYGQARGAGRLQGDELRQFDELGAPIRKAVADSMGIGVDELKKLVSEGKVGFSDLQRGLKSLTAEGGKFFGMTRKGADTLEGQFARLSDAADELKREFGRALIEEIGLKDATKDATRFTSEMRAFVNDLRPTLRFVGDLGKGLANVGGELLRNAPLFARGVASALRATSPFVAKLVDDVERFVGGLKDFKLDPHQVIDWAFNIGESLAKVIDLVIEELSRGLSSIYDQHVKPIVDALQDAAKTWNDLRPILRLPGEFVDQVKRDQNLANMKAAGQIPEREAFLAERMADPDWAALTKALRDETTRGMTLGDRKRFEDKTEFANRQHFLKSYLDQVEDTRKQQYGEEYSAKFGQSAKDAAAAAERAIRLEDAAVRKLKGDLTDAATKFGVDLKALSFRGMNLAADPLAVTGAPRRDQALKDNAGLGDFRPLLERAADALPKPTQAERDALAAARGTKTPAEFSKLEGAYRDKYTKPMEDLLKLHARATDLHRERAAAGYDAKYAADAERRAMAEAKAIDTTKKLGDELAALKAAVEATGTKIDGTSFAPPDLKFAEPIRPGFAGRVPEMRTAAHAGVDRDRANRTPPDMVKDAMKLLAGPAAMVDPNAKMPAEFKIEVDPIKGMKETELSKATPEVRLPTAAEYGSREAAELVARANSVRDQQPLLTEAKAQTQVMQKVLDQATAILREVSKTAGGVPMQFIDRVGW